jgi:hypothetical protein
LLLNQWTRKRKEIQMTSEKPQHIGERFCSGFEGKIEEALTKAKVMHEYEAQQFCYHLPDSEIKHVYTPDFSFPESSIVFEVKGYWFKKKERNKYRLVKKQHPEIDLRFLFQKASLKLHKDSKSTYADWAKKYGFKYSDGIVPDEWLGEIQEQQQHQKVLTM